MGKIPLYRERITSITSRVHSCAFITELAMNLICISSEGGGGVTWEVASKGSLGDLATNLKYDVLLSSHSVKHTLDILLISYSYHLKLF